MQSPSLLLHHHLPPLPPRFPSLSLKNLPPLTITTPTSARFLLHLSPLRLPAAARLRPRAIGSPRASAEGEDGRRKSSPLIPIARSYEGGGGLARLEVSGAARREQAVAAAAAADGGAAAEAHLAAGGEAMVMEAFLPGPDGDGERSAASTRVILQAKEVREKATKIKKDFGADFFSENESDSENMLAMALKQVVMEQFSSFRLEVICPAPERGFQDLDKPRKVAADFSISSSDKRLLSALAEAIFSCVIEDAEIFYLGGTGGLFQKRKMNCSLDSSVCIHRISEAEVVNNAREYLERFNLAKASHEGGKAKDGWWPAPNYRRLGKIGGPDFICWAYEFVPAYKLQINSKAFENTKLEGCGELANNMSEVLLSHFQLVELGNVLDMYFEDQFTIPGKTFHSHWNVDLSKIKKCNGYLNKPFAFLAGSCIILCVGIVARLCWPQSPEDKRLFMGTSCVSSSWTYRSDIHSQHNREGISELFRT